MKETRMTKLEMACEAVTSYVQKHHEEKDLIKTWQGVIDLVRQSYPDIEPSGSNMHPSDICYNRMNGIHKTKRFDEWPHALIYLGSTKYQLVGKNYPYTGNVLDSGKKVQGFWKNGIYFDGDDLTAVPDIPVNARARRDDLAEGLKSALREIPVRIDFKDRRVLIYFRDLMVCGAVVEEEGYLIYNATDEWKDKTSYYCERSENGTWHYYLETIDEVIGEVQRLVLFEATKSNRPPSSGTNHTSELSSVVTQDVFEKAYVRFLEQADKNALSKKSQGQRIPYGIPSNNIIDGGDLSQHFGQGAASNTPYMNWWIVSVYYIVNSGRIVLGIEEHKEYPYLKKMKPIKYEKIGNKKIDVAVFYETDKEHIEYAELYDRFITVSEEVMKLRDAKG